MADPIYFSVEEEQAILQGWQRRSQAQRVARQRVTPEMAQRAAELAQRYPSASSGVIGGAAAAGLADEQVAMVVDREERVNPGTSWFDRVLEGTTSAIGDGASKWYERVFKPMVRGTFLLVDSIAQEVVQRPFVAASAAIGDGPGNNVSFGEAYRDYGNSEGVTAFERLREQAERGGLGSAVDLAFQDDDPDTEADESFLGQGFFAGGMVAEDSYNQRTLEIDGQRANFGNAAPIARGMADIGENLQESDNRIARRAGEFISPGGRAYSVVSGTTQFAADVLLDPVALATGGTSAGAKAVGSAMRVGAKADDVARLARAARAEEVIEGGVRGAIQRSRQFEPEEAAKALREAAGAIDGKGTVLVERAEAMLKKPEILDEMAKADTLTIWESWSKAPGAVKDPEVVAKLGKASTPEEVAEILLGEIATGGVREQGFYKGMGRFRQRVADSHLSGLAPSNNISVDDLGRAADSINSWAKQANVPREVRAQVFEAAISATDQTGLRKAAETMLEHADLGEDTSELARLIKETPDEFSDLGRAFGIDEGGKLVTTPAHPLDDTGKAIPTAQFESEMMRAGFSLPDIVTVRRAARRANKIGEYSKALGWADAQDAASNVARLVTRDIFKPAAILRPAYIVRIGLEEQARLAFSGLDSIFNHPVRYLQANVRAQKFDPDDRRLFERAMRIISDNDGNLTDLDDEALDVVARAQELITRDTYGLTDKIGRSSFGTRAYSEVSKAEVSPGTYARGWSRNLTTLAGDKAVRRLAQTGGDIEDAVAWARGTETGRKYVERIARMSDEHRAMMYDDDLLRQNFQAANVRLHAMTGGKTRGGREVVDPGNSELIEKIARGRALNPSEVGKYADEWGPQYVVASTDDLAREGATNVVDTSKVQMNRAIDWLFDNITGKPTTYFARMPAFRQFMIRDFGDSMKALSSDVLRDELFDKTVKALRPTKDELATLRRQRELARGKQGGIDDLSTLNEMVKARAADQTKKLLFDVSTRSNFQVHHEAMFPFFDAWKEVTETWLRLSRNNKPAVLKAMQGYQSLEQNGTIYNNDRGEKVFAYPAPQRLMNWLSKGELPTDVGQVFEGRVEGVNLVAQGHGPGFGPIATWGVGLFPAFDREGAEQLREWIAPFGTDFESSEDLTPGNAVAALTPAWADKAFNALSKGGINEHQWNSTVGDVASVLSLNPKYDPGDPKSRQQMLDDAASGARFTLLMRAFTQGVLITGASSDFKVREGAGSPPPEDTSSLEWFALSTLAREWHEIQERNGYDSQLSTVEFIERFGVRPFYVTQPKTNSVAEVPVTKEGDDWVQQHRDAYERYPSVVGFFVPADIADGELDFTVWGRQLEEGDRQSLTAEQRVLLGNKALAYQTYNAYRDAFEGLPTKVKQERLQMVRDALDEEYPGWQDDVLGIAADGRSEESVKRLFEALDDPVLADSPLAEPLRQYQQARDHALASAKARGEADALSAKGNGDIAEWLMGYGEEIALRDATFARVWNRLLRQELEP